MVERVLDKFYASKYLEDVLEMVNAQLNTIYLDHLYPWDHSVANFDRINEFHESIIRILNTNGIQRYRYHPIDKDFNDDGSYSIIRPCLDRDYRDYRG